MGDGTYRKARSGRDGTISAARPVDARHPDDQHDRPPVEDAHGVGASTRVHASGNITCPGWSANPSPAPPAANRWNVVQTAMTGSLQNGFNCQRLHVDVCLHERGKVRWNSPDLDGLNSVFIHHTGNFDAAAGRQVFDQVLIGHVALNHSRNPCFQAVDDQ